MRGNDAQKKMPHKCGYILSWESLLIKKFVVDDPTKMEWCCPHENELQI